MMTPDEAITKIRSILRKYDHEGRIHGFHDEDGACAEAENALEAIEFVVDDTDDEEFDT